MDTRKRAREQEGDDGRKCFVYNLPWDVVWQDLKRHFKPAGQVVYAGVIKEKGPTGNFTGRSKGCGIVEFETVDQALNAITLFNGTEMNGRKIFVRRDIEDPKQRTLEAGTGSTADDAKRNRSYEAPSQVMDMHAVGSLPVGGRYRDDIYSASAYVDRNAYDLAAATTLPPVAPVGMGYDLGMDMGFGMRAGTQVPSFQQDASYQERMAYAMGAQPAQRFGLSNHGGQNVAHIGRRVFVSNLNYETTWQQLKDHFKAVAPVVYCSVMKDKDGRSKGVGIVEFETPADALRAISRLSNSLLHDRQILVREDQHDQELPQDYTPRVTDYATRSQDYTATRPQEHADLAKKKRTCQVVVHGLPYSYEDLQLRDMFKGIGFVAKCQVIRDGSGKSRGWGTVLFEREEAASRAISQFNGSQLHNRTISVKLDEKA